MRFYTTTLLSIAAALFTSVAALPTTIEKRGISQDLFNDLGFYFQYAASAYADSCAQPNGNTLVANIARNITDTQGFIVRDDTRKEFVVVFRGSSSTFDFILDFAVVQVPFISPGVKPADGSWVHSGFLTSYNSVAVGIITTLQTQLAAYPGYGIATSGHSLGGALASIGAVSLKSNFPNVNVRMYSYGQPRVFNKVGALWFNSVMGANAFRSVHTSDGVPTILPQWLGYRHHGVEYWATVDPATAETVRKCAADGEDGTCSSSIASTFINAAHATYYNIYYTSVFCA